LERSNNGVIIILSSGKCISVTHVTANTKDFYININVEFTVLYQRFT
jgi:hypothetical protein